MLGRKGEFLSHPVQCKFMKVFRVLHVMRNGIAGIVLGELTDVATRERRYDRCLSARAHNRHAMSLPSRTEFSLWFAWKVRRGVLSRQCDKGAVSCMIRLSTRR